MDKRDLLHRWMAINYVLAVTIATVGWLWLVWWIAYQMF